MTYRQAADAVLRTARRRLTMREITERALELGLGQPQGKRPEATKGAALYCAPPLVCALGLLDRVVSTGTDSRRR